VWRFAVRLTGDADRADDLTQETMLRAWRHRRQLRDPRSARPWLFRIAANLWRDEMRRRRADSPQTALAAEDRQGADPLPDAQLVDREDLRRALRAMDGLPPRQREVLYLHSCEALSLDQIAEVLNIRGDAVKASLSLARKKMRQKLPDLCPNRSPVR
jgi:RNA polymerase sigma-70 factor (ECF subfamily)